MIKNNFLKYCKKHPRLLFGEKDKYWTFRLPFILIFLKIIFKNN